MNNFCLNPIDYNIFFVDIHRQLNAEIKIIKIP